MPPEELPICPLVKISEVSATWFTNISGGIAHDFGGFALRLRNEIDMRAYRTCTYTVYAKLGTTVILLHGKETK